MSETVRPLQPISHRRRALLDQLLREKGLAAARPAPAVPPPSEGPIPLSFAQERLWFFDQLEPGAPFLNVPVAIRLEGELDAQVLERALNEIVRRHAALRTTFAESDGRPMQVIAPQLTLSIPATDLRRLPGREKEDEARRQAAKEATTPFDLTRGPLVRARLLNLGAEDHVLLLTTHHIVSDGWSAGVLVKEAAALYAAFLEGRPSPLPDLPIQYADFARLQRAALQGETLEAHLSYWRRQLGDSPPLLQLPFDRPRPTVQSYGGAHARFELPGPVSARIRDLGREEGATLFMTLLAAFKALLYRYTGQTEVLVGSPIANRTRVDVEPLVGFFANTLVLKTDLAGNPTFRSLLARVRATTLGAYAHQDLPFEKLVEELQPERSLSHHPLFQVMFILQNAPAPSLELPRLRLRPLEFEPGMSRFDLTLSIEDDEEGLGGTIEYNTDLFDEATILRMLGHFETLVEGIASDPDRRLSDLPLLPVEERRVILDGWAGAAESAPTPRCVHRIFEELASRDPEAVAVIAGGETLTYGEVNRRANRLAHRLRRMGVGPESIVGLASERSCTALTSLVAILKAGGACLPLDTGYPAGRLALMLEDARADLLLAGRKTAGSLPSSGVPILPLEEIDEALGSESGENPSGGALAGNLAYVLYTSGSTGRPKGVAMSHGALGNLIAWQIRTAVGDPRSRTLQIASLSFDVSFQEIFSTLCSGGTLVIASDEERRDPARLLRRMDGDRVGRLFAPFVLLQQIAEEVGRGTPPPGHVREVISAGEALRITGPVARFFERLPGCALHNQYGPTESHVVTAQALVGAPERWPALPPIGRPIDGARIHLLDATLSPVPPGVPGEIHIGGPVLARGYLHRPDLTADRFIPDPFGAETGGSGPGSRLYRTGDLARWLPDGRIEFLGRVDTQVKVRGFRVEPLEVEALLCGHPEVREAAVVARDEPAEGRRLVAYIVPRGDRPPTFGRLRAFLQDRIPDYMIPASIVALPALPLTPSGKVDRRALPEPDTSRPEIEKPYAPPRTPTEETLARIWAGLLRLDRVGVFDNFFGLGGHSLLAIQVVSRVRDAFRVELSLRRLFENPTVAALAEHIAGLKSGGDGPGIVREDSGPREDGAPTSFAQQRLWFFEQLEPGGSVYNLSMALRMRGALAIHALERALGEIVRRHETLRTTFAGVDGEPVQRVQPPLPVALPVIDLRSLPGPEREAEALRRAAEESRHPLDLSTGPLLRVSLLRLGEEDHVLLGTVHHIVADGWSLAILAREVTALYEAFLDGRPSPLPDLDVQYADFARWQRRHLQGGALVDQIRYWKGRLRDMPAPLPLPADRPRPALQTFRGGAARLVLPPDLAQALRDLGLREGATLFMVLLSAFKTLLLRYTGEEDVVVGTPVAGRNRAEIEPLIGFFVNTLVLRTDLSGDPTFIEALARVRETALGAYANQDVPFERLVEEIDPERSLSRHPLFQVMFILQSAPQGASSLPGLEISPLPIEATTSKFDLTLSFEESEGELIGRLEYNADLFDGATMERMLGHFRALLDAIVADPRRPLSGMPLLGRRERGRLLGFASGAPAPREAALPVHALFERQAAQRPGAIAAVCGGAAITYADLNRRANALAHRLTASGVGPESIVGICVERSPEALTTILAVLKAGGACLPLDPTYPAGRLALMIEDAGAALILALRRTSARLPESGARILIVDGAEGPAHERTENPEIRIDAGALAYVLFTSGSTGRPKGVAMPHRALSSLVAWQIGRTALGVGGRTLQFAPLSFDVSFQEIFSTLGSGGTVVLISEEERRDLARVLERDRVERIFLPFTALQALAEAAEGGAHPGVLREIVAAGEPLRITPAVASLLRANPGCVLDNQYGPTETHVVTAHALAGPADGWPLHPPIGRPVTGARIHILDARLEPVPIGVAGEIHVGGASLARGYAGRPDLTAERFVPDPFAGGDGDEPGARLYRTGDRARWTAGGCIEFLGRADDQLKVRGYRIEPGEIEANLRGHPGVREASVTVVEEADGDRRLGAFVVPREAPGPSASEIRAFLQARLPSYMIPSAVASVSALPLTPSGKIDRRARPPAGAAGPDIGSPHVPPGTENERLIARIWSEILKVDRVGIHDGFFDLGGHSLLATRVWSRIRDTFRVDLPLRKIFEAPTVAGLAAAIGSMVPPPASAEPDRIRPVRRSHGDLLPLSFAQQRLWFLHRWEPQSTAYHLSGALRFGGELRIPDLERSLAEIVRRHEGLRTVFLERDGVPWQLIREEADAALSVTDLDGRAPEEQRRFVQEAAAEQASRPFDLERGPLLRTALIRLSGLEHVLLYSMHHIVTDGWSMGVFTRELAAIYEALVSGREPALPPLPVQYADFAAWQRAWLSGERLDAQIRYWKGKLRGAIPALDLPVDHPRPAVQTFRGSTCPVLLPAPARDAVAALSRREGATSFMTLLAAFKVLLARLAGQEDITVGAPIAGRNRSEIEGLIGFFVNTLVLRDDLSGDPTFREVLSRVRETALSAFAHQDLPFEQLVEEVRPQRDLSRTPLFQVFFNLLAPDADRLDLPGLTAEALEGGGAAVPAGSKFDLTLYACEREDGIGFTLLYNADLFAPERVKEMGDQLVGLLQQIAEDPDRRISRYSLLTPAAAVLLPDPSRTLPRSWAGSVVDRFDLAARRNRGRTAVSHRGRAWTYDEVRFRSARVAGALGRDGVGPGQIVAIEAERSAPLVWALLGTLEAGAAFLILDPAEPALRLADRIRAARPAGWIRIGAGRALLPEIDAALEAAGVVSRMTLTCDDVAVGSDPLAGAPEHAGGAAIGPGSLAYIAFTSGSGGVPKGIVGEHGPLAHFLDWHAATFDLGEADRFSVLSGLGHDPLLRDIFTPLCLGGTVCIPDPDDAGSPSRLVSWMRRERVSVAHLTPAMGEIVAGAAPERPDRDAAPLPMLRYAFFGGDVLAKRDVERLRALAPGAACVNFYGATETPQAVAFHRVTGDESRDVLPIGRGIEGCQLLVLNASGHLAGIGEPGEIHVRSPYLAREYLNDPPLTAERFIVNPATGREDDRLYRTGDLGRCLPDGNVAILGRKDRQVKVRGFRIEPEEIESALAVLPGVRECFVTAHPVAPGDNRLIAYVVPEEGTAPSAADLRARLRERLPEPMTPSAFVLLAALPLTPNGKIDRRALPAPEPPEAATAGASDALHGPTEEILAGIWARVLGLERVGARDDFFDLGGHSLLAMQVLARVRDAFAVEIPIRRLFEAPTVAGLGAIVDEARTGRPAAFEPILPDDRRKARPLSFSQRRLWFLDRMSPGSAAYNMTLPLRLSGGFDVDALRRSLDAIALRHDVLRTTFACVDGEPVQIASSGAAVPLRIEDLSHAPAWERPPLAARIASEEARRPFDLSVETPLRVLLIRLAETDHLLLATMHHIASDAWSNGIFGRELAEMYEALREGRPARLPELPFQYADFARWQREWLRGDVLAGLLAYWRGKLAAPLPVLELPADRPRPTVPTFRGARRTRLLPGLARAVRRLGRSEGATVFMTLLAAFKALLHRYTGLDDIALGTPVAGRARHDVEDLIGFFVNTLVIRTDLSGNPSFRELVRRVRETSLQAYAHQDLPFERLVEEIHPQRSLSRHPIFQVMFVLENAPEADVLIPGMELRPVVEEGGPDPLEHGTSRFDWTLLVKETLDGLAATIEYSTDLFEAGTIERALDHFGVVIESVCRDPDRRLSEIPILTPEERRRVVSGWNQTRTAFPRDAAVHQVFDACVQRSPGAVAISSSSQRVTYGDLNVRANRIGHYLRGLGVGPEVPVALCMRRSADMIAAMLGILKAGGAYVPLDPAWPRDRQAFMAKDSRAAILVTQDDLAPALREIPLRTVILDAGPDADSIAASRGDDPGGGAGARNLAYVMYTSGSTGMPRAVGVEHRSVIRLVKGAGYVAPGPEDVFLHLAPASFDASTFEVWGALLNGARLAVMEAGTPTLREIGEAVQRCGVTTLFLTTSLFHLMVEDQLEALRGVRRLLAGGDVLSPSHARKAVVGLPGCAVINGYGPTEVTTFTCCHEVGPEDRAGGPVPIGKPISNTKVYVLDEHLFPVPVGVPGELHAGGEGLARGYLNDAGLTAERFIPDPFSDEPGERLYRTGDRARWLPDGTLEFLGRMDHQVKVRGFRVEPAEIEAVLRAHPGVRDCSIVARQDAGATAASEKHLVAYVRAEDTAAMTEADLRSFLRVRLPDYMLPSSFVILDSLPLTPTGKVDRLALPAPDVASRAAREDRPGLVSPRDAFELGVARLWEEVLGGGPIGVRDDFFALGGHSFLAVRLIAAIGKRFGRHLPLASLFEEPTVEHLAHLLRIGAGPEVISPLVPIQPAGSRRPFFCVHPAGGGALCYLDLARSLGTARPFYGLQAPGLFGERDPFTRIEEMAAHYAEAARGAQPEGPLLLGGWSLGGVIAIEMAHRLRERGRNVSLIVLMDTLPPSGRWEPGEETLLWGFLRAHGVRVPAEEVRRVAGRDRWTRVLDLLAANGSPVPGAGPGEWRRLFELYRTNVRLAYSRVPAPVDCPLAVFRAGEPQPGTPEDPTRADTASAWGRFTRGAVHIYDVPGNHDTMVFNPHAGSLAGRLRRCLDEADAARPDPVRPHPGVEEAS